MKVDDVVKTCGEISVWLKVEDSREEYTSLRKSGEYGVIREIEGYCCRILRKRQKFSENLDEIETETRKNLMLQLRKLWKRYEKFVTISDKW